MFYIDATPKTIYINRELTITSGYTFKFINKDEYNIEYSEVIIPTEVNSRYTKFIITTTLKKGTYKFYIYGDDVLIYNDLCVVNLVDEDIVVVDDSDNIIVID